MSTSTSPATTTPSPKSLGVGVALGLLIGLAFALVIRLIPESVVIDTGPRLISYGALAISAPTIVLPLWFLADRIGVDPRQLTWAALSGALLFDGAALGFVPDLYDKTGDAWAHTAAALLWAFGWLALTQLIVELRRRGH